ncbi:MYLK-like protein [Mya arenaria]|uniref:MYLK-like protein n=1 Tax=Mya arenaria TaxID=6604 RepID=A0ABY7EKP2_MYAAR|nr:MYLK-like protein [Mya arenaria]
MMYFKEMRPRRKKQENVAADCIDSGEDLKDFVIEHIPPKGLGVRTTINRTKGDFLMIYPGELITEREGEEREEREPSVFRYFFQYKRKGMDATSELDVGPRLGRLVNHGGKGKNCVMKTLEFNKRPYLCLFAAKDIPQELVAATDNLENMLEAQTTDNLKNMLEAQTTDNLDNTLEAQTTDNLENMLEAQTTDNLENMQEAQTTDKLDNTLEAQTTDNLENMLEAQTTDNLENMLEAQTTDNLENMQEAQTTDNLDEMLEAQTTDNLENMQEAQTTDNLDNTLEAQTTDNLENMLEAETTDNLENMQEAQTTDNLDEMLEAQTTDNLENMLEAQTTDNLENMLEAQTTDNLENMLETQTTDNLENMLDAQTTDNLENMLEAQTTDNLENMQEAQTTDNLENPLETQTTYNLENMLEAQTTDNLENMLEAQTTDNLENMLEAQTTDNLENMREAQTTDNLENMREAQTTDNLENMLETQTTDNLDEMLEVQTKDNLENTLEAQTTDNLENILEAQTTDNLDEMLEAQTTDNLENMLEAQTTDNLGNMLEAQTTDNLGNMLEAQTSNNLENMLKTQIMNEEQVHPSKIQDQISGNNTAAEELIKQATDLQDGDAKAIPHGTNKFWDELQQLTHTLKHMFDRLGNQEPAVEPSLIREQQETLEELALQNSNVNPLNQPVDPTRRQVAVVDPSRQFSENELGCDYDGLPSDDESIVLSSGSSYAPSVLSGEDNEDDDEDDDSSVIIPVTQTNKRSWTAIGRVASSEDIGDNEPPRKQRTLPVLGPSTSSEFDATSKNTSDGHHGKTWKKSCFKNVYVESYKSNDGKRNYSKKSYCYYCKNLYKSKMSKHLFAVHAAEPRVRKISQMEVLQKGEGNLIVYRRPGVPANAYDYIHCRFCKGFYHHKLLWSHVKTCSFKPDGAENDTERNFIREARCEIAPFLQQQDEDIEMLDEVIDKMKETKENPGLKKVCQEDELIRQFGLYHLGRLGPLEEQRLKDQDNVRTKMRSLARLLVRLNGEELFSYPLSHFICAQKFDLVAKTVKEMYQEIGSSQLGLNLGHYIKQVSLLKSSMCLRKQNCGRKKEANEFTEMFDAEWKGKVSSVANRSKRLKAMNKRCELPSTEDLVSLKKILVEEIQIKWKTQHQHIPTLFNKRRVNEVSELKVSDFQKRIRGDELDTNTEIYNSLAVSEKALLKRMELLEVRGKSTRGLRKVFVILSTDMVEGLSHLLMVRAQAGVPSTNTFLFSRCTDSPQDGCEALRVVTSKCHNLAFPERVRTTKLRKYLATTTQIMDMRDDELKLIADHMGHSVAIHTEVYRMQTSVLERTKVARALLALEDGKLQGFNGRNLSSVSLDELPEPEPEPEPEPYEAGSFEELSEPDNSYEDVPEVETEAVQKPHACTGFKKRWSKEEESALREAFDIQIKMQKNVSTMEIRKAQKCYPVLQGRSEAVIRTKINNIKLGKYKKI